MEVIYLNDKSKYIDDLTLTIGNFDGLHKGHMELVKKLLTFKDYKTAAMTFNPHPSEFFRGVSENITTIDEKISLFEKTNIDYLIVVNFNMDIAKLTPDEFIEYLKVLGVKRVIVGHDYRFGTKASGSTDDLVKHFETIIINEVINNNFRISSTLIKELIKSGNVSEANNYLGYPFFLKGFIEHGNKIGRTLGFPTANIHYDGHLIPKNGIYITLIEIDGKKHFSVTNVGNNPTVNYSKVRRVEAFILNYNEEIYDKDVKLEFIERIRDELKFDNIEDLKTQMNIDVKLTEEYSKKHKSMIK